MSRLMLTALLTGVAFLGSVAAGIGDGALLAWSTNSCGAERMVGGNLVATVNVGQVAIGERGSRDRIVALGVLSAEQLPPLLIPSAGAAKLYPDGSRLALADLVVTSDPGDLPNRIYVESADRSSGIGVEGAVGEAFLAREGSHVNVVGGVSTVSGERVFLNPMLTVLFQGDPLLPLEMTNGAVGGARFGIPPLGQQGVLGGTGLNNVGLLVRTTGLVVDDPSPYYTRINDGSTEPFWDSGLRVEKANLDSVPGIGSYITVTGISGVRKRVGSNILDAMVRPRKASDLEVLLPPPRGALASKIAGRKSK